MQTKTEIQLKMISQTISMRNKYAQDERNKNEKKKKRPWNTKAKCNVCRFRGLDKLTQLSVFFFLFTTTILLGLITHKTGQIAPEK